MMISSYNDMTLGQLLQLQSLKDIEASDAVKEMMFISVLSGYSVEELRKMPNTQYASLQRCIEFLGTEKADEMQPASEVTINGNEYTITDEANKVTAGQYIDFVSYSQNGGSVIDLLSCLIIPKGHGYAEGYDVEKVKADITDLPLPIANYISFFWRASLALYARRMARQMRRMMRRLPKGMRMKMQPMTERIESVLSDGGAFLKKSIADLVSHRRKRRE